MKHVCPVEKAGGLESGFRKLLQNPYRILKRHVHKGMTVLDFGCGPGLFSIEAANMVGNSGKVIAVDFQEEMLRILEKRIKGKDIQKRIKLHKCNQASIGIKDKVDFVLAFYVLHEVPSQDRWLKEIKSILKSKGRLLVIEPKFRVNSKEFNSTLNKALKNGFKVIKRQRVFLSRGVVLQKD